MTNMPAARRHHAQTGATLVEVLVAVLVLAIGMLGIAATQAVVLRNNMGSLQRSQATVQTYAILEAMRANVRSARANQYNQAMPSTGCVTVTGTNLATRDLQNWNASVQRALGPSACGSVQCASRICTITIRWDDSRASGGSTSQTLVTRSRL